MFSSFGEKNNVANVIYVTLTYKFGFDSEWFTCNPVDHNPLGQTVRKLREDIYRVYKKKCPEYEIASKLDICKITDTNSNQRLI